MTCILITGIGGDIAQGIAAIVRQSMPGTRIHGTDVHDEHGGRLFCDDFTTVPRAIDPGWFDTIETIGAVCGAAIIVPTTEAELDVLCGVPECPDLRRWMMVNPAALRICLDKLETARALGALGLDVPWTVDAQTDSPRAFPCILKPRRSSGSKGVAVVSGPEEARLLATRAPASVFQELLLPADREVTCAVYREGPGRTWVAQLRRRLVGGFTGWAEVIDDAAVATECRRIADGLEIVGCINVQLRLTGRGPRVFEVNPRVSSTALMRHLLGFQDVTWNLWRMLGLERSPQPIEPGQRAVRVQGACKLA
jgi:carbamoyl-phosphate synthase large subunit